MAETSSLVAEAFNAIGRRCGRYPRLASAAYACASAVDPTWSVPWFNRGLDAKFQRRWEESRRFNKRATELDPNDPPGWWNLGIAATALGDWETAREAWTRYGVAVPAGQGPLDMRLGLVPIRVSLDLNPEVVWCQRLDPARAVIENIPLPDSRRGIGDLVLHDGAPSGTRQRNGRPVPVFDELQLLSPGTLSTFACDVVAPTPADVGELEALAGPALAIEDWTASVRMLCRRCSEGSPHEHSPDENAWKPERSIAVAAPSEDVARAALAGWQSQAQGREVASIECVLRRAPGAKAP